MGRQYINGKNSEIKLILNLYSKTTLSKLFYNATMANYVEQNSMAIIFMQMLVDACLLPAWQMRKQTAKELDFQLRWQTKSRQNREQDGRLAPAYFSQEYK